MNELDGLSALIIEPNQGVRASIHNMLSMCGLSRVEHAGAANAAVRLVTAAPFDLILCEYDLDGGQDGQQLLEDLRHHKLISLQTMFIMVTAEGDAGKVVSAAELQPTDYVLKPFTAERLMERIARALDKRTALAPAHQLMDSGDLHGAIAACQDGMRAHPRYTVDFLRLRAELHMVLGEPAAAEPIYQQLVDARQIGWAGVGVAKTLFMRERYDEAAAILEGLLEQNRRFVDAYDWLARTLAAKGELAQAQAVLSQAVAVSPHAVRRLRKLGDLAFETGDIETAEKIMKQVVSKAKYSQFRDPEDHVKLVRSLIRKGDPVQAAAVIRDLDKSMGGQRNTTVCSAISSAMLHEYTGNDTRLAESLATALAACRDSHGLSADVKLELARNCLQNNLEEGASDVMLEVMRNASNNADMARAMQVFEQAGRPELAAAIAQRSRQAVVELVAAGASRANAGDFRGAVTLMLEAVDKLPDNPQVVFNAAVAVLKCLENQGWDERLGRTALGLIDTVRRLDPVNAKLPALAGLHQQILKQYDKGTRVKKA